MEQTWFPLPPAKRPDQLHPIALAYIGDAIFEVYIRQYVLSRPNHRPDHLHKLTTRFVTAKAQARILAAWLPQLTEEELAVVKRGRNAKSGHTPKSADVIEYRQSTALECLVGYLYYTGQAERLEALMSRAASYIEEEDGRG